MGLYDTFVTEPWTCPKGHPQDGDFQTKDYECWMFRWEKWNRVPRAPMLGKSWVYTWCKSCERMYGRHVYFVFGVFVHAGPVREEEERW